MTTTVLEKAQSQSAHGIMREVLLALLPSILVSVFLFGAGIVIQLLLASLTTVVCETLVLKGRKRPVTALDIYSGLVSAWILVLCIPVTSPFWLIIVGVCCAILLAKHCYGGVGMNIFNPAMVGFCILYISYPELMSQWPAQFVDLNNTLASVFGGSKVDTIAMATALTDYKVALTTSDGLISENTNFMLNALTPYQWMALSYLLGGLLLIIRRLIDWRLPLALIASACLVHLLLQAFALTQLPLLTQLLSGGLLFAAFFIITDPVTAPASVVGRLLACGLAGCLIILLRQFSVMADAIAFSILLVNLLTPMIDDYKGKPYGGT